MSWIEVLKFITEVLRKISTYTGVNRKKQTILAEKLVKMSSLRSVEICLFS